MPKGKGSYSVGAKGSNGCSGYPVVGGEGKVHGCHPTKGAAMAQTRAIYASENAKKSIYISDLEKALVAVGDFVLASSKDEIHVGRVEHVMSTGAAGIEGSKYYLEATEENPLVVIRTLEFDDKGQYWEETQYLINVSSEKITKINPLALEVEVDAIDMNGQVTVVPEMKSEFSGWAKDYTKAARNTYRAGQANG